MMLLMVDQTLTTTTANEALNRALPTVHIGVMTVTMMVEAMGLRKGKYKSTQKMHSFHWRLLSEISFGQRTSESAEPYNEIR